MDKVILGDAMRPPSEMRLKATNQNWNWSRLARGVEGAPAECGVEAVGILTGNFPRLHAWGGHPRKWLQVQEAFLKSSIAAGIAMLVSLVSLSAVVRRENRNELRQDPAARQVKVNGRPRTAVLVELFTSEGCSSCPPADALLARLASDQPIAGAEVIALEEHVDYWNQLGWTDPFSSSGFSARQVAYAHSSDGESVYTPQMIVDGRSPFVGSDERFARRAIAQAAREKKPALQLSLNSNDKAGEVVLQVRVPKLENLRRGEAAEVFLAITEDGLESAVKRGENAGRRLAHAAVVRSLQTLGPASASAETAFAGTPRTKLAPGWNRTRLRAVVFVQEKKSKRVLGAQSMPLS